MVSDSHCDALVECLSSLTHTYNPGDTQAHADIMLLDSINPAHLTHTLTHTERLPVGRLPAHLIWDSIRRNHLAARLS